MKKTDFDACLCPSFLFSRVFDVCIALMGYYVMGVKRNNRLIFCWIIGENLVLLY